MNSTEGFSRSTPPAMSVLDLSVPSVPASQPQIGFFFCWCHYLPIQGCLSLAALSYRPHPSGWQRQVPHGFRRGHVPYLVFPATKNHGQLVTSDTTILTRGSKGAQVCLFLLYEPGTICNEDNSFTEDVCRGKTRWFLTPRFCGNQMTSKERTLYHHFIPQAGWGAKIAA